MQLLRPTPEEACCCRHPAAAHEHYRQGSDCSLCPAGDCLRFRSAVPLGQRVSTRLKFRGR
jgi:hypothetical protein